MNNIELSKEDLLKINEFVNDVLVYKILGKQNFIRIKILGSSEKERRRIHKYLIRINDFVKNVEKNCIKILQNDEKTIDSDVLVEKTIDDKVCEKQSA